MPNAFLTGALAVVWPCLAMAQVASLQIKIIEGEGAVHEAGSRQSRPLTVEVTDEIGTPVAGAAVSFLLPDDGPGGVFSNGLRTELLISDATGRATIRNLRVNQTAGPFQVRITAVKDEARAGVVSNQFITDARSRSGRVLAKSGRSSRKWVLLTVLLAGAGAGVTTAVTTAGAKSAAATPVSAGPALTIGPPVVLIGRP